MDEEQTVELGLVAALVRASSASSYNDAAVEAAPTPDTAAVPVCHVD